MHTGGRTLQADVANNHQKSEAQRNLVVRTLSARSTKGILECGPLRMRCALGCAGSRLQKREGDGASPIGTWMLRHAYFRSGRLPRPRTGLSLKMIRRDDGWCDASQNRNYNRPVSHPYPSSAEHLWREDGLYDLIVVLGYNDAPRVRGRGSAIFLHCAQPDFEPTHGCIALARRDLVRLMARLNAQTKIRIA